MKTLLGSLLAAVLAVSTAANAALFVVPQGLLPTTFSQAAAAFDIDNIRSLAAVVPEPGTLALLGLGLAGLAATRRRKR